LNIRQPDIVCKATDHIQDMIELIKRIEANGYSYFSGGNLYFDITKFPTYGQLARLKMEDLKAGAESGWMKTKESHGLCPLVHQKQVREPSPGVGQPLGTGISGVAHRMFRHEYEVPGRTV